MTEPQITVYTPDSSLSSPRKMLGEMFSDLFAGRELAWHLAVRDIRAQYRQAYLGMLWAFMLPLANALAWIFLNSSGIVSVDNTTLPYPVYAFTGTMLWAIFMESLNAPMQQVNAAKGMLSKLNFPREALIVSGIYQTLFNAVIKIALLLGVIIIFGFVPGWSLILFPLGILSLILLGTSIGLLITPIGLLYSDVGRAVPLLMQFLMFLTPVVFPVPKTGWAATLFGLNPLTPIILTARGWLTGLPADCAGYFSLVNVSALIMLLLAWAVYRLAMPILVERMSS